MEIIAWFAIYFATGYVFMVALWRLFLFELPRHYEEHLACLILGMVFPLLPVGILMGRAMKKSREIQERTENDEEM